MRVRDVPLVWASVAIVHHMKASLSRPNTPNLKRGRVRCPEPVYSISRDNV